MRSSPCHLLRALGDPFVQLSRPRLLVEYWCAATRDVHALSVSDGTRGHGNLSGVFGSREKAQPRSPKGRLTLASARRRRTRWGFYMAQLAISERGSGTKPRIFTIPPRAGEAVRFECG